MQSNNLSYRSEIAISPKWDRIVRWYFPDIKTDEESRQFIKSISVKSKVNKEDSLYGKRPVFLEFNDCLSGLYMIWSRKHAQFLEEVEEVGYLLEDLNGGLIKDLEEKINADDPDDVSRSSLLTISPHGIFAGSKTLATIPYWDIINFLIKVEQETKCSNRQIKKFPDKLQEILEIEKINYAPIIDTHMGDMEPDKRVVESEWLKRAGAELYGQKVIQHIFETEFYSLAFFVHFFNPAIRPWTEIDPKYWNEI